MREIPRAPPIFWTGGPDHTSPPPLPSRHQSLPPPSASGGPPPLVVRNTPELLPVIEALPAPQTRGIPVTASPLGPALDVPLARLQVDLALQVPVLTLPRLK